MDLATARARLERMTQWNIAPALTTVEVDDLLEQAKRVDAFGYLPTDALWTPTWNLRAAAAEGWRWKAAKVVSEFDAATGGGKNYLRSQQYKHCMEMAKAYSSGRIGTIQLGTSYAGRIE